MLKRADFSFANAETHHMLERIERSCILRQEYAQRPRRFCITLWDDVDLNHTVYADVFYIDGKPVLHVVDEVTRFRTARWLSKMSSENLWLALRRCWIDVYLCPPDVIDHDAGKNVLGEAFQTNLDMLHIRTKAIPVKAAHSVSFIERYYVPDRRAFHNIKNKPPI